MTLHKDETCNIKRHANDFRRAMSAENFVDLVFLFNFPTDCGKVSSTMLGVYLFHHNIRGFCLVGSERPVDGVKHWWLEKDGIVVDITADQFSSRGLSEVVVESSSEFHAELDATRVEKINSDFCTRILTHPSNNHIRCVYEKLVRTIQARAGKN